MSAFHSFSTSKTKFPILSYFCLCQNNAYKNAPSLELKHLIQKTYIFITYHFYHNGELSLEFKLIVFIGHKIDFYDLTALV